MTVIPFEELYHTDFFISESFAKYQNWYGRDNIYSSIGRPKPSHTLLWFKNCSGSIESKDGRIRDVKQGQLVYTAKGTEYTVHFTGTAPERVDTVVLHFQMTDKSGCDIAPSLEPQLCLKSVDMSTGLALDELCEEFKKSIVCVPETNAAIYRILAIVCKQRRSADVSYKFACIKQGIELLESGSEKSIAEIAKICGVSECYFRRLFGEYSGCSPMTFRQQWRVKRAEQLLLSDMYTVGEIASELHFADIYHFSKTFKRIVGCSPTAFTARFGKT